MIAYIFTEQELKFLCRALNVRGLAKHQFPDSALTDIEYGQAVQSLSEKKFITVQNSNIIVNSGIAVLIKTFGTAKHLLVGDNDRIFTAYINDGISVLLINDMNSSNYMLYPFEDENNLVERLHENNIYTWKDIRLEDK